MSVQALKECGYRVKARLLDAQWLGVPQMRQRIIFLGVRNDLGLEPVFPHRYPIVTVCAMPCPTSCVTEPPRPTKSLWSRDER